MPSPFKRRGSHPARQLPIPVAAKVDPLAELQHQLDRCRQQFRSVPLTPRSFHTFENELEKLAKELARTILEEEVNRLEPEKKSVAGQGAVSQAHLSHQ